jgi:hypothetical protein
MKTLLTIILVQIIAGNCLLGQKLKDYHMVCYCSGSTPHSIVKYDNNWEILLALKNGGKSKSDLDSLNIKYTDSQLRILRIYKIIQLVGNKYHLVTPVLDSIQTNGLKIKTKKLAELIMPEIVNEIDSLNAVLYSENLANNQFSILFSYVLDGLVWTKFEKLDIIKPLELTIENSPWTGTFWMLTPHRETKYGTNTYSDSIFEIGITSGLDKLSNDKVLKVILKNYSEFGRITDQKLIESVKGYKILNAEGTLTIPVIDENYNNKIYRLSDLISGKICLQLTRNPVFKEIIGDLKIVDPEQATIIVYHEVMWDLLSLMIKNKIVTEPKINSEEDASKLLYLVRRN